MKIKSLISDFNLDHENECLIGKVGHCEFNLAGAKIESKGFPSLEGFVVELFQVTDLKEVSSRIKNVDFTGGDWYVRINIDSGWKYFENDEIIEFYIVERTNVENVNFDKAKLNANSILLQLKNMSARIFSKFYLDIRGGETSGAGRNEHGPAHFHVIENGTNKDLGKVYFPTITDFASNENTKLRFDLNCKFKKKEKRRISEWVFASNCQNLKAINQEWILRNEHNNRT
ncbi:hypothetical protein [Nonlabens agnitus]|uniref:Uncharacterized protein n=1 Tax=Nonlabens agnitus TaxID=870484 RepID=A0A2S9WQK1_9FLAO|nr:hypothetical protein [Nonlabens agnitus]PRP65762.1 hypothetical protein BST86_00965 [Nonlabens agnitus]